MTVLVDVRSPSEFEKGHIPGAINIPLLTNQERHLVGHCYKHQGKEAAILLGLECIGPKMKQLASEGLALPKNQNIELYCHRGGMRSNSLAWLWRQVGLSPRVRAGGYKHYRTQALALFEQPLNIQVLSGATGVGKTEVLQRLAQEGAQVLDLEKLAHHKGSAFGKIGERPQPSTVQFENTIADQLSTFNVDKTIWVESESRRIGTCLIPHGLWRQLDKAPRIHLLRSKAQRIERLCTDYRDASFEELHDALRSIQKKLGSAHHQMALQALEDNDRERIVDIALGYYDYQYDRSKDKHQQQIIKELDCSALSISQIAERAQEISRSRYPTLQP